MKKYFLMTMLLAFFATTLSAQTGYEMVIEKIDGTKIRINTSEVKHSYFQKLEIDASNAVDLGLPSGKKWANMNIGANTETDFGTYFAWGETTGYTVLGHNNLPAAGNTKTEFSWSTYKWGDGTSYVFSKYNSESSYGTVDYRTVLERSDDAAFANWGAPWRMPTKEEFEELLANTTSEIVYDYNNTGVNGYKLTGSNGNYIFLPAADCIDGYATDKRFSNVDNGYYWSSTISENRILDADNLCFYSNAIYVGYAYYRCYGMPVRAIWDDNNNTGTDAKEKLAGTWEITSCDDPDTPVGMTFTFNENGTGVCTYQWYSDTFNYTFDSNGNFTKVNADGTKSGGHLDIVNNVARGYFTYSGSTKQYSITLTMQSGNTTDNYINGIYYSFDSNNMTAEVIAGENQYTSSVTIPSTVEYKNATYTVTEIHEMAFYDNRGLTSITFPTTLKKIGEEAFRNCSNLTEITLPNSLTTIEDGAFRDCVALTTVNVGTGIETIKKKAFGDCYNLKDFYCNATTPPTLRDNVFQYSSYNTATLHVPNAETYRNANSQWAAFGNVVSVGGATTDAKEKLAGTWTLTSCDDPDTPVGMTFTFNSNGTGVCTYQWYSDTFNYTFDSEGTFTKVNADGTTSGGHLDIVNNVASGYFTYSGSTRQYSITLTKQSGNDNPEPAGEFQGPKRVFGDNQLKSYTFDDKTITLHYDNNGYVTQIDRVNSSTGASKTYNISYGDQIIVNCSNGNQWTATLESHGFIGSLSYNDDKGNAEHVTFNYNDNDQLTAVDYGEGDVFALAYSDGNITSMTNYGTTITYGYDSSTQGRIQNQGHVMEFDNIYGIDMDDFNLLYYIGGLGKSTNDLPMSGNISGYTITGTWTVDNSNRATRGEFSSHTLTWNWDDQGGGNTPQSSGVFQGPQRIFGNNRVKSFDVEGYSHSDFIYDDKGFLSKIKMNQYVYDGDNEPGNYDATFEYNEDGIVGKTWINGSLFRTIPIPIGSNGFQTSVVYDNDKWTYTYDEDGQMTEILYSYIGGNGESHSERITLTWENGDIVQQKVYIGNQDPVVTNITYSTFDTSAIENLAGVMEFHESMNIDLEAMYYYAGFLGKGTKHLPLAWNNTNGNSGKNTWTLDDAGRVVKLVTEKNAWGNTTTQTFSVKWEGDESLESSLLGTWYTIWPSTDLTEIQGYAFNSDGTATGFEGKLRQSDNYSPTHAEQYNCYYTLSGNTLTIRDIDNTDTYTISLNNDGTITFLDSRGRADTYTRLPEDKTPLQFYQEMAESLR